VITMRDRKMRMGEGRGPDRGSILPETRLKYAEKAKLDTGEKAKLDTRLSVVHHPPSCEWLPARSRSRC
jgi:hypothetical protein